MDGLDSADVLQFEGFHFDRAGGYLTRLDGAGVAERLALGSRALDVLALLVKQQGKLVSKDEIMKTVWPGTAVEEGNLTVQISALRRVLDCDRAQGSCIQTIPGRGYRFVAPVTRGDAVAAAPISSFGKSGTPIAVDGQPESRSAEFRTDTLSPTPAQRKFYRPWRALVAGLAGTLCLVAAVVAATNWRWFSPREDASAPRLSIVVLPFGNLSNDPDQQYLADSITEDLTTDLSRIAHMFVISADTAFTYRDKPTAARQIGRELGVRYLLEGSVQRSGGRVRLNAQLIDAKTAAHLWAGRFDSDTSDLFALQDEITRRIAASLEAELIAVEARRPVEKPDALDYILKGRAIALKPPTRERTAEAIAMFERALVVEPASVEAQTLLSLVLLRRVFFRGRPTLDETRRSDIARAKDLIEQVSVASPRSWIAHYAKANLLRAMERCTEAIPEYEAAIAFNRNYPDNYADLGVCRLVTGAINEVIPLEQQAIRLSPRDHIIGVWEYRIGIVHLLQSRTNEALVWFEKACSDNPGREFIHAWLASAYALNGGTARAAAELAEARRLGGEGSFLSIAQVKSSWQDVVPGVRALFEATYFAGLRKAGMPEE